VVNVGLAPHTIDLKLTVHAATSVAQLKEFYQMVNVLSVKATTEFQMTEETVSKTVVEILRYLTEMELASHVQEQPNPIPKEPSVLKSFVINTALPIM
jgi:hypothetical protein